MSVESDSDREGFFDPSDFGVEAEILGDVVEGFFDEITEFSDALAPVDVQSTKYQFMCPTKDIPSGATEGTQIIITREDGSCFEGEIVTIEPDGFGISTMTLRDE